ncbi:MAG: hypothetical protein QM766_02560 [Burkholderiaceae bacterium]
MERADMEQDFDFDEWAELYRADPLAFEARRQAVLALEIARHRTHAGAARRSLGELNEQLAGCAEHERLDLAFGAMADSLARLTREMADLRRTVEQVDANALRHLRR